MTEHRFVDVSESGAHLHLDQGNLVIDLEDGVQSRVPVADLAAVAISHPRVAVSRSLLAALAGEAVGFVVCDDHHMPVGMMLPLATHYVQAERFALQAAAPLPMRKRLWQQVVRAKIRAQASLLEELRGKDAGLRALAGQVRSGDSTNLEAQAARRYWPLLIPEPGFVRERYGPWPNPMLNYGYAILRAITARAIAMSGLHPSLGLHHHNRYDAFCLADDLMEPFRPVVDRAVIVGCSAHEAGALLQRSDKVVVLQALQGRFLHDGQERSLFDWLSRLTSSLAEVFAGDARNLAIPAL